MYTPFSWTETEGVRLVLGEAEAAVLAGGVVGGVREESGKSSLERGGVAVAAAVVAGRAVGASVGGGGVESWGEGVRSGPKPEKNSGRGVEEEEKGGGGDASVDGLKEGGREVEEKEGSTHSGSVGSWEDEVIAAMVAVVVGGLLVST